MIIVSQVINRIGMGWGCCNYIHCMSMLRNGRSLILGALWLEFPYQTTYAPLPSTLLLLVIRRDNVTIKVAHDIIVGILEYNIRGKGSFFIQIYIYNHAL